MATLDEQDIARIRDIVDPVAQMAMKHDRALYGDDDSRTGALSRLGAIEAAQPRQLGVSGVISAIVAGAVSGLASLFLGRSS